MTKPTLPDHIIETAQSAADLRGIPVEDWLAEAVHDLGQADDMHRNRVERRPGPWPGWSAIVSPDGSHVLYKSPDGEEIRKLDLTLLDRRLRATDTRRPWTAQYRDGALLNKRGALRTFASAEAAKAALGRHYSIKR